FAQHLLDQGPAGERALTVIRNYSAGLDVFSAQAISTAKDQGLLTQEQIDAAEAANTSADGVINETGAYKALAPEIDKAADAQQKHKLQTSAASGVIADLNNQFLSGKIGAAQYTQELKNAGVAADQAQAFVKDMTTALTGQADQLVLTSDAAKQLFQEF